jgi:hypothetical protein
MLFLFARVQASWYTRQARSDLHHQEAPNATQLPISTHSNQMTTNDIGLQPSASSSAESTMQGLKRKRNEPAEAANAKRRAVDSSALSIVEP